jgi:7 transmembrane sweet-taste receptor of 3 GCPR
VKTQSAELIISTLGEMEFDGLTGKIVFGKLRANSIVYGGDRVSNHSWSLVNFNEEAYASAKLSTVPYASFASFISLASLNYFGKITECVSSQNLSGDYQSFCGEPIFNTVSGTRHDDTKIDIDITAMGYTLSVVFYVFAALSILITVCIFYIIFRNVSHRQVKRKQPNLLLFSCSGFIVGAIRVCTGTLDSSNFSCGINSWLGHLAVALYVFPQVVKFYRVYVLLVQASLKKVALTDTKMAALSTILITVFMACIAAVVHGTPCQTAQIVSTAVDMQNTVRIECPLINSGGDVFLYLTELLAIGAIFYFNYALREAPAFINEASVVAASK